jgi:predicted ATPase
LVLTGKVTEAVQNIASGIAANRSTGNTMWTPLFLSYLARANAEIRQFNTAWTNIHEAMTAVETTKENWYEAEINRVAGEIALLSPEPDATRRKRLMRWFLRLASTTPI